MALVQILLDLMDVFFRRLQPTVVAADWQNRGREILGSVPDREEQEDVEVGIDQTAYNLFGVGGGGILEEVQRRHPDVPELQRVRIYTEHHPEGWGSDDPLLRIDLDPIDGSDEYLRRIRNSVYSVVSVRDARTLRPLVAATLDVYSNMAYLMGGAGKVRVRFAQIGEEADASPLTHTSLSQKGAVVAAYFGRAKYLLPWVEAFREVLPGPEHAGITWHGKGGSFIYAFVAAGIFSAYAMPNEPVSEILPGLAFAELAGFPVLVREEDGSWVPFSIRAHGTRERVPFLLAACTKELAEEMIRSIKG